VRRPARLQQGLLAAAACALCAGITAAAGGAGTPSSLQQRADALRQANSTLAERANGALLGLFSLDAKLEQAQARLDALDARAAAIRRERASVRRQLRAAQQTVHASQRQLALRLHVLYEQGQTDPLALVLGATSIDAALTSLDDLNRSAQLDRRISAQARHARSSLTRLAGTLAARDAEVQALTAAARETVGSLAAARAERERYLSSLAAQRRLNVKQIGRLDAQARTYVARSAALTPPAAPAAPAQATAAPVGPPSRTGRMLTVSATGYSLEGTTASGIPVGYGVVAVDPSIIPLGTRMTIPGYGEGVAADTGSAVRGAVIDLWFPTVAQALAWGRRAVTITLH
jgi:3D (Asp-Asp-Asp) domain-containing protein